MNLLEGRGGGGGRVGVWGELDWNIGWLRVGLCIGERGAWARQGGGMEGEEMDLAENLLPI